MKLEAELFVQHVQRKVSGQGNVYFLVDLVEKLDQKDENGNPITKEWNGLYCASQEPNQEVTELAKEMCLVELTFWQLERKVGDKTYHDIKASIVSIKKA